jgi:NAD(P)-dependent dehydrogenase (short-subunit alcohol dehydrogenase family)
MAGCDIKVDPLYYPSPDYTPEIDLKGMVAVITGASRGVGLGAATELQKVGVTVIGTSRTPEDYSLPYELLPLEVTSQASVDAFVQRVLAHEAVVARGGIDILVSNAGRFILGNSLIRPGGKDIYYSGLNLSLSTIFLGNARVVNSLLPALEARHKAGGYARLAITVSPTASYTGGHAHASIAPGRAFVVPARRSGRAQCHCL